MKRVLLIGGLMFALALPLMAQLGNTANPNEKLRIAAGQHEIVSILLQEGEYARVLPEFRKILALGMKGEQQRLLVQSAWGVAQGLNAARQFSISHQVIDETLAQITDPENRFTLMMLKGKTLKDEGRLAEAVDMFQKAQQLQMPNE